MAILNKVWSLIRGFSEGKPQLSLRGAAGDVAIS